MDGFLEKNLKKLLKYLKNYKKEAVLGPLFKLFEATLELIVPLIVALIIDRGIEGQNRGFTALMCLLLAVLGLVGLGFSVVALYYIRCIHIFIFRI